MCRARSRGGAVVLSLLASIANSRAALAQAWVPDKGDGTFALSSQFARAEKHLFSVDVAGVVDPASGQVLGPGNQASFGEVATLTCTFTAEYVPLRRLAVTSAMMWTTSKYSGPFPESSFDDGRFHGDLQDMVLGARYQLPIRAVAIAPSADVRFPLTDYNRLGHVGAGMGLNSFTVALNSGRSLGALLPNGYVFANASHQFVQDVAPYSLDRNMLVAGAGIFLSNSLSLQSSFSYSQAVDGVDWWWAGQAHSHHQDVTAKETLRRVGASVGYSLSYRVGLALSGEWTVSGANVHAVNSLTLGASWSFWDPRRFASSPRTEPGKPSH